ncbi:ABC transporter permease [Planctomycetota bacterium]
MLKLLKVAQREYVETAKTKTFILSIVMLPVILVIIVFFAKRLARKPTTARPPMNVAVTDLSNQLSSQIKTSFDEHNKEHPNRQVLLLELQVLEGPDTADKQAKAKLRRGELDAYIVVDRDLLDGTGKIHLYTHKPKPADSDPINAIKNSLREVVQNKRYELHDLSRKLMDSLRYVPIEEVDIDSTNKEERVQKQSDIIIRMMTPFFFMYLLFLGIMTMGQQMLSSIIEEKSSRVIEVLLSAVSPFQLMAGKILGLVSIGLTVVCLWGVAAIATARSQGLNIGIAPTILPYFVIYYILAFLLFGSTMVGIGSICNTIKETQSLMTPVMLVCIVPLLAWQNIIRDPNGMLARGLSFFPPTTPMVMIVRLSAGADIGSVEILGSIALLAVSVLAAMWIAAKVFRTGILMYGKRPGLMEVARWLKQT